MTHAQINTYHSTEERLSQLEDTLKEAPTAGTVLFCMNAFTALLQQFSEEDEATQTNIPEHLLLRLHSFAYKLTVIKKQYELARLCQNN